MSFRRNISPLKTEEVQLLRLGGLDLDWKDGGKL